MWYSQQQNGVYVLLSCAVPGGWCYTESDYPPDILPPQITFNTGKVDEKAHPLSVPRDLEKIASDVSVDKNISRTV